jgi:FecR protein
MIQTSRFLRVLSFALVLGAATNAVAAEEGGWSVRKSSGEVWMTTSGAQPVSLRPEEVLKPGDTIRTGRNGRVLLVRGEETILVSPNSVVGLPAEKKEGLPTTIVQQAGSILLEVERRNVKHFEVETPYLAAVVKGTQFRVSVNAAGTRVDVLRGQVEVADFKSGQIAQVMPGQAAMAFVHGKPGLSLSGSGTFNPIEQGKPRASSIERITVPKTGLSGPRNAANGQPFRALAHVAAGGAPAKPGAMRISSSLGEVRLNFHKVTHGLAHGSAATPGQARSAANKDTIWMSRQNGTTTGATVGSSQGNDLSTGSGNSAASTTATATSTTIAAAIAAPASNSGNGNSGDKGNGNANGNGNNGNNGGGNGNGHGHSH